MESSFLARESFVDPVRVSCEVRYKALFVGPVVEVYTVDAEQ